MSPFIHPELGDERVFAGLHYAGYDEECLKPVDVPGRGCTFPDHP